MRHGGRNQRVRVEKEPGAETESDHRRRPINRRSGRGLHQRADRAAGPVISDGFRQFPPPDRCNPIPSTAHALAAIPAAAHGPPSLRRRTNSAHPRSNRDRRARRGSNPPRPDSVTTQPVTAAPPSPRAPPVSPGTEPAPPRRRPLRADAPRPRRHPEQPVVHRPTAGG